MEAPEVTTKDSSNPDKSNTVKALEGSWKNTSDTSDMKEDTDSDLISNICKGNSKTGTSSDSDVPKNDDVTFNSEALGAPTTKVTSDSSNSNATELQDQAHCSKSTRDTKDSKVENTAKEISAEIKKGEIKIRGVATEDEDPLVIDEAGDDDTKSESDRAAGSELSGGESEEKEFEPTIDMIMNDFDDEQTMEEEEALESQEDNDDEINALNEEQDMPLEELMKLYNYGGGAQASPPTLTDASKKKGKKKKKKHREQAKAQKREYDDSKDDTQIENQSPEKENNGLDDFKEKVEESKEDNLDSSNGAILPLSDDEDNEQDEEDLDDDDDLEEADDEDDNSSSNKPGGRHGSQLLLGDGQQTSTSEPSSPPPAKKSRSELARFYEAAVQGRTLRSTAPGQIGQEEVDEDDSDGGGVAGEDSDDGRDYSWKKTIMIGPSYQASVPGGLSSYGDTLPYENEDKLLWNPYLISEPVSEEYLSKSQESLQGGNGVTGLPLGAHIRDDEQALYLLLQCGYNCEEGLRRRRMNAVPPADTMSLWSEEECRAFELGLRLYGKDFHMIQQQKVRTRSVGELVQFYYLWKKTERHDVFANATRLEKKKYTLHPGTTDYMDRFIDETDPSRDRSSSPNFHSLLASYGTDNKKGVSILGGANLKQHMHESSVANGTSANLSEMACTNNTSASMIDGGISNTNNGDLGSAVTSSNSTNAGSNMSHIQNLPISGSSGPLISRASFNSAETRSSESAHESIESNNITMDHQSS